MKALDTSSGVWVENSDFSGSSPVEQPHKIDLPPGHANAQAGCFRDHHQFSGEMFYKRFARTNGLRYTLDELLATMRRLVALKLSPPKFTLTKRDARGRAKGRIIENPNPSNYVVAEAANFATK